MGYILSDIEHHDKLMCDSGATMGVCVPFCRPSTSRQAFNYETYLQLSVKTAVHFFRAYLSSFRLSTGGSTL